MMAANFNPVDIKPDLKKAVEGFGLFKVDLADHLNVSTIQRLSILIGLKPGEIDSIKRSKTPGLEMVNLLDDREFITPTDIRDLLKMLRKLKLAGLAARIRSSFQTKTSQAKTPQDLEEEQLVASSASSSTAKSPPSQKGDRTEKQLVASSASSSTAKSPPSQKGDCTEKQLVASSASSSTAKSPPSQNGDRTEEQTVASSASSSTAKSPPSQKGDRTETVFISFSSRNEEEVTKLVSKIEPVFEDDSCWMYTRKNLPGDNMLDSITAAIGKADIMLCMITQDYIDSEICRDEFNLAKAQKKHIIPLHLEKVKVPYKTTNGDDPGIQLEGTKLVYARMYIKKPEPEFQKVIAKMKKYIPVKDANASGRPSTSGSQKRKSSHDGDDSEAKVTRKE